MCGGPTRAGRDEADPRESDPSHQGRLSTGRDSTRSHLSPRTDDVLAFDRPLPLEGDAEAIGDPIDEREVADNRTRIVNGAVRIPDRAQRVDVDRGDGLRRQRQHVRIGQQCLLSITELGRDDGRRLQVGQQDILVTGGDAVARENGTESRPVMVQSIVTVV